MIDAAAALARLREGNARFVDGPVMRDLSDAHPGEVGALQVQTPFAVILGCSDSRVPVEIVFDQGLGDLFVVRVAGNIAASSQIGSIEYAAQVLGVRLVVVMGHTDCGAVQATLQLLRNPAEAQPPHLTTVTSRVGAAVAPLLDDAPPGAPSPALVRRAVRANVRATVRVLHDDSPLLQQLVREQGLRMVGAEYDLASGAVVFLED